MNRITVHTGGTQIWCALIAMLLLAYLKHRARYGWSLSNLVAILRQQLLVYRDLWRWLDEPLEPPEALQHGAALQLELKL